MKSLRFYTLLPLAIAEEILRAAQRWLLEDPATVWANESHLPLDHESDQP